MEHRALAATIVRLAGLLVIVSALSNTARSFGPVFSTEAVAKVGPGMLLLSAVLSLVIPVVLGLVLIYFPSAVTTKVLRIPSLGFSSEAELKPLERVAFGVVGLWLTIYAILDAVYIYSKTRIYVRILEQMPTSSPPPPISPDDFGTLIAAALQLIIGVWLLLGNRTLTNLLARLRG